MIMAQEEWKILKRAIPASHDNIREIKKNKPVYKTQKGHLRQFFSPNADTLV